MIQLTEKIQALEAENRRLLSQREHLGLREIRAGEFYIVYHESHPDPAEQFVEKLNALQAENKKLLDDNQTMHVSLLNDGRFQDDMDEIDRLKEKIQALEAEYNEFIKSSMSELSRAIDERDALKSENERLKEQIGKNFVNRCPACGEETYGVPDDWKSYTGMQLELERLAKQNQIYKTALEKCKTPQRHELLTGLQHEASHGRTCIKVATEALKSGGE